MLTVLNVLMMEVKSAAISLLLATLVAGGLVQTCGGLTGLIIVVEGSDRISLNQCGSGRAKFVGKDNNAEGL